MRLYYTPTSPYVRKVLVVARELGIADRLETVFLRPVPMKPDPELSRSNPLSKIPALVLDDGTTLFDSPVISEYLQSLAPAHRILPADGPARWRALRIQALCDGVLDAAVLVFYERANRPAELHWQPWLEGQTQKAAQGLDALEREASTFGPDVDLAQICAGVTVAWLLYRTPIPRVLEGRPALARWYATFKDRPSMTATEPPAG